MTNAAVGNGAGGQGEPVDGTKWSPPPLAPNAWLRFDLIQRELAELPRGSRIVEFGAGQGAVGTRLAASGHEYIGVEPSDASREVAVERLAAAPGDGSVVADLAESAVEAGTVDLVCAFEVLEHIEDDVAALGEWVKLLRPGGRVLVSMPAWSRRFGPADEMAGHFRRYDPADAEALAVAAGLVDVRVVLYGFPLGSVLEWGRNRLARRELDSAANTASVPERTAKSGAWHQPPPWAGRAVDLATLPARLVARRFPERGVGLLMQARMPADVTDAASGPTAAPARVSSASPA